MKSKTLTLIQVISHVVLLAILIAFAYNYWVRIQRKAEVRHKAQRELAEQNELERAQIELGIKEREAKEREEWEQRRKEEEERRKAAEEEERRKAAEEEKETAVACYNASLKAFANAKLRLISPDITNNLATATVELFWLLPNEERNPALYRDVRETNGSRQVWKIDIDGKQTPIAPFEFDARIRAIDCFAMKGNIAYFRSARTRSNIGQLSKRTNGDPAEVFFGNAYGMVKRLKPWFPELTFDILFKPSGENTKIFVENIVFGEMYSMSKVREAIEENYPIGKSQGGAKPKKYRRTTKTYSGKIIKTGMDGITYVPESSPPRDSSSNFKERWYSLQNRARKEDREELAFNENQKRVVAENIRIADAQRIEEWRKKIDRILDSGTLYFEIKGRKVE